MLDVTAFCDASHSMRTKRAAACTLVLSDTTFYGILTKSYTDVDTGARAELLGIIQTVEFIRGLENIGTVMLYCDSKSIITLYSKILESQSLADTINYRDDWVKLIELSKGLDIKPMHISGHADKLTGNTVCDTVAHSIMKWENT